jgi:hypothetical protein
MTAFYFDEAEQEHRLGHIVLIPIIIAAVVALVGSGILVYFGPMHTP